MRRLIIFALVFGLGGSLLWYLESERLKSDLDRAGALDLDRPTETSIPPFVPPSDAEEEGEPDGAGLEGGEPGLAEVKEAPA
ncbi:MAG: hypothetical protein P8R43_09495, partial [Planctomycetota bacterium]|nr:hypothetical protein [Planctomycetota bacterium]